MNKRLKIWLPTIRAGSGSDVFVQRLANGLRRAGHDPMVQWFPHRYELTPWRLRFVAAPEGVDVIHTNTWQGFAFARPGTPLIVTEHLYVSDSELAPYRTLAQSVYHRYFCERWIARSYRAATSIVAVSESTAAAMRKNVSKHITVVRNWVDTKQFSPPDPLCSEAVRLGDEPFKLLFVGNPSRRKGADLLQQIAARLGPSFELHCLGGLRENFDFRNSAPNIVKLPSRKPEEMPALYRQMDAVLVPTRYEPFGYVALEAMASGLPVVGFASTGTNEICVHGETALLSSVNDVEDLVRNAQLLEAQPDLRRKLGAAGRERALSLFTEERAVAAYIQIYRDADG